MAPTHTFFLAALVVAFVSATSVVDPLPVAPGIESDGLCSNVRCQPGFVCSLRRDDDCVYNCELKATCVAGPRIGTGPSNAQPEMNRQQRCGFNEEFQQCSGCELQCGQDPATTACATACMAPRCQCRRGFVRNPSGNCVRQSECPVEPKRCQKANEEFKACGTACEPKCNDLSSGFCRQVCVVNVCQCKLGFVRNPSGDCVRQSECPAEPRRCMQRNEEFKACGTACERKCNDGRTSGFCRQVCVADVCQCKLGFVRNPSGACVRESECPAPPNRCPMPNEELKSCGSACEPKCNDPPNRVCTMQCLVNVCQCRSGFVRNPSGVCVSPSTCPRNDEPRPPVRCGRNERFNVCGTMCPATCDKPNPGPCSKMCKSNTCECLPGFLRNSKGDCVHSTQCPRGNPGCSAMLCPVGTQCVESDGRIPARCLNAPTCATVRCSAFTECRLVDVACFTTPCFKQPQCVPRGPIILSNGDN